MLEEYEEVQPLRKVSIEGVSQRVTLTFEQVNDTFTRVSFENNAIPNTVFYVTNYHDYQFDVVPSKYVAQVLSEDDFNNLVVYYAGYFQSDMDNTEYDDYGYENVIVKEIEL